MKIHIHTYNDNGSHFEVESSFTIPLHYLKSVKFESWVEKQNFLRKLFRNETVALLMSHDQYLKDQDKLTETKE